MIKIMVVEDNIGHSRQIVEMINALPGYTVLYTANDGADAIKFLTNSLILPDIISLDVEMRKIDGVTAMDYINEHFPSIIVIALTSHSTEQMIDDLFSCGVTGFLFKGGIINNIYSNVQKSIYKNTNGKKLFEDAIRSVASGTPYVDERIPYDISKRSRLIEDRNVLKTSLYKKYKLSRRQKEIIGLNIFEVDYGTIAAITNTSKRTIETNVKNLSKKFEVTNGREGVMAFCLRRGATIIARLRENL